MIPSKTAVAHSVTTAQEIITMKLDERSTAHLMGMMTSLYSDPIAAITRELSTNALDSHIEAGTTRPVEITLPGVFDSTFTVKDYGVGLDLDGIRNVWSMYGASTKRESDAVAGMLGVGSKSPLTYVAGFSVTSVKNGVKIMASVAKGHDGVGRIHILDTLDTDEPNGVTIQVPVKEADRSTFRTKAMDFFRYWKPGMVLVNGVEPSLLVNDEDLVWVDEDVAVIRGGTQDSRIVMGNVAYPVDFRKHVYATNYTTSPLARHGVVAWVPMGSVDFTPSREALHYTPNTNEALDTIRQFVDDNLKSALECKLGAAATPWAKAKLAWEWSLMKSGLEKLSVSFYWDGVSARINRGGIHEIVNESNWVVTNYQPESVAQGTKQKLQHLGAGSACLVWSRDPTAFAALEGRKNVIDWPDLKAVELPKKPRAPRGQGRSKTPWTVWIGGTSHALDSLDTTKPIVYVVGGGGSGRSAKFPDAQVVEIQSRQANRLKRLYPSTQDWYTFEFAEQKRIKDALTREDHLYMRLAATTGVLARLLQNAGKIDDPTFAKLAKVKQRGPSALTDAASRLGITSNVGEIPGLSEYVLLDTLYRSYESRTDEFLNDVILYLNVKYAVMQAKKEAEAA